jgi:hypothetical protein
MNEKRIPLIKIGDYVEVKIKIKKRIEKKK